MRAKNIFKETRGSVPEISIPAVDVRVSEPKTSTVSFKAPISAITHHCEAICADGHHSSHVEPCTLFAYFFPVLINNTLDITFPKQANKLFFEWTWGEQD